MIWAHLRRRISGRTRTTSSRCAEARRQFDLARRYDAYDLKRFKDQKRYALVASFLGESRKILLDHLAKMHDQCCIRLTVAAPGRGWFNRLSSSSRG